jgi:type VI protein secretion system component VasF
MSRLQKELRKIRAQEKRRLIQIQKIDRQLRKNAVSLQKTALANSPQRRMLGVERKRAKKRFLIWLGLLAAVALIAASYIWKNRASILPGDITYPG